MPATSFGFKVHRRTCYVRTSYSPLSRDYYAGILAPSSLTEMEIFYLFSPDHLRRWSHSLGEASLSQLLHPNDSISFTVEARGHASVRIELADQSWSITRADDRPADFTLLADLSDWTQFFSQIPPRNFHSVFAMRMRVATFAIEGDDTQFARYAGHVRRVLEAGRLAYNHQQPNTVLTEWPMDLRGIQGKYIDIIVKGQTTPVYVETAGTGPDLLLLHTAGSDSRQNHPLLSHPDLTSQFTITSFDLPGHGKSQTLPGHYDGAYSLDVATYRETILQVCEALQLDRPLLSGASMAGEICVEMAISAPEKFSGIIACEASEHVPGRRTAWINDPSIDTTMFAPEWIHGLLAPTSPEPLKQLVLWSYSQGGYGTFAGDIDFYSGGWDARDRLHLIDTSITPLIFMTGEYDYSCTPEMSEATAAKIPGAHYWMMPGLGHFPLSENPDLFLPHLFRAVDIIRNEQSGSNDARQEASHD